MTFDDQLKRAFDTLTERLRDELDRQVRTVVDELTTAAHAERDDAANEARLAAEHAASVEIETVVARARQEAHEEGLAAGQRDGHEKGTAAGRETGHEEGHAKGFAAGRQEGHEEGHAKGFAFGLEEGHHQGHNEGLAAGREAGHQEGLLEGRRLGVIEGRTQAEQEKQIAVAAALASAAAAAATVVPSPILPHQLADSVRAIGRATSLTDILDSLVTCAAREAERAGVWMVRGSSLHHWRSTGFDAPEAEVPLGSSTTLAEAARSDLAVSGAGELAVPIAMSGEVMAVLYVANADSQVSNPDAVEVLTRYAARCLEALTAFKAARALTSHGPASAAAVNAADAEAIAEGDVSARRYARLLVSEIKLYHEAAVLEGRRDRDLASRLGGEIARARMLYEERVPPDVRLRVDYFHDELVRTLADGDATLLQLT